MKTIFLLLISLSISTEICSQTIEEQLNELGVFKEKVVFEWLKGDEVKEESPYVIVDGQSKPKKHKVLDPKKIKRIEKLEPELANHLFGDKSKNGVFKIITKEEATNDSYFKVVSNPAHHSTCKTLESKNEKKSCTEEYLKSQLKDKIGEQEEFVLAISIDANGKITNLEVQKGNSNEALDKLFDQWKNEKYAWYPGIQRDVFIKQIIYFKHKEG